MCALAFALLAWSLPVAKVAEVIVAVVCCSYCYIADYPATNAITHYPLPIAHCPLLLWLAAIELSDLSSI